MKILHIGKYYPPFKGGIENFMSELIEQQVSEGHKVTALVHQHEIHAPTTVAEKNGFTLIRARIAGILAYAPISFCFPLLLRKTVREFQPDIIHVHMPNLSAFWCLFSLKTLRTPWVVQWQSDVLGAVPDLKIKLLYPFYRLFERTFLKRAKRIIVASPNYAKSSSPLKPFQNKVSVIPLGLSNFSWRVNEIKPANLQDKDLNLLIVGRLTYYKGHDNLLIALKEIIEKGVNATLTIIGNGELLTDIVDRVQQLGINEHVFIKNNVTNAQLLNEIDLTDLLCLPSIERTEAFGVVLLEAMRQSKACLVSDVPGSGMSWVVKNKETGIVVKNNDVYNLVDAMLFAANNIETLNAYGTAGLKRFKQVFQIAKVNQQITLLYSEILRDKIDLF